MPVTTGHCCLLKRTTIFYMCQPATAITAKRGTLSDI